MENDSQTVDAKDLPAFLRQLADSIEKDGLDGVCGADEFRKFKISGKNVSGQLSIKVRFKTVAECSGVAELTREDTDDLAEKPAYSNLKKRMKNSFRTLFKVIHDGQMPPNDVVESFLADSELLVTYSDHGDANYHEFSEACRAFKEAVAAGDVIRIGETIDMIAHEKSRCHSQFA